MYINEEVNRKKLLNYLIRFFEICDKFTHVYFNYKHPTKIDRFNKNIPAELNNVCGALTDILKIIKVRVSVVLRNDAKANDIIKSFCFKAINMFQKYLVHIDFFNKEMYRKSALNLQ